MEDKYLDEFTKTCEEINKLIMKKWIPAGKPEGGTFAWSAENATELSTKEEKLYEKINILWMNNIDFDEFKKKVLEWGQTILQIYKKHAESMAVKQG